MLGVDPAKIAVLGFSQGATMVWTLLLSRWPRADLICAAVALSGRLMPQLLEAGAPLHERLAPAGQSAALPLFCSHGGRDEMTPVAIGRANRPYPTSARDPPPPPVAQLSDWSLHTHHRQFLTAGPTLAGDSFLVYSRGVEAEQRESLPRGPESFYTEYEADGHTISQRCVEDVARFLKRHAP